MRVSAAGQVFSADADPSDVYARIEEAFPAFVERVMANRGITMTDAARASGIARQTLSKLFDRGTHSDARPRWAKPFMAARLYVLPLAARIAVCADILGPTHGIVELPCANADEHDLPWFARSSREVLDAVTSAIEAAADGRFDRAEGVKLESLCDRGISILLAIRELARQATRDGVVTLRPRESRGAA